jgi:1-deoxy-D-xylulose-5-phosphate reductoisomerase
VLLSAHRSSERLLKQAACFKVKTVVLSDPHTPVPTDLPSGLRLYRGASALCEAIAASEADLVLNALVGSAGLRATLATLAAGKKLALANKESLVVGGDLPEIAALRMPCSPAAHIIPVDSEHSAIFQCLSGEPADALRRIWLTASGGPFRSSSRAELAHKTARDALKHPTWSMGPKITIDSATLMNKGLEIIEAHHLFNCAYDNIYPLIHPQSMIHSMVELCDGSIKAQLGAPDMRIPLQFAFSFPERWEPAPETAAPPDFFNQGDLSFSAPDQKTFGCLALAIAAGKAGGSAPVVLNAANEAAVAAFLQARCGFLDIEALVRDALDIFPQTRIESVDYLEELDASVRRHVGLKLST